MEREYKPPTGAPEATTPAEASAPERPSKRKKEKPRPEQAPEKASSTEQKSDGPEKSPKQKFGARVMSIFFGEAEPRPAAGEAPPVVSPENTPQPLETEPIERAGRMRRLARSVIAFVRGEAEAEPARARAEAPTGEPLDTEPLVGAADDLREAADDLDDTLRDAKETLVYERSGGYSSSEPHAESSRDSAGDFRASERIVQRVEQLEARVDTSSTVSLAAVGLGVVAVLVAGHEYFARKRVEKAHKKLDKSHQELEKQVQKQQQEFVALKQEEATQMDRQHRQDYYERLSEFTHQQATSTREVNRELQQNIEAAVPIIPEPLPEARVEPRTPQTIERISRPEPLRRVENADTVEQGGQSGNAGTGFFGGGMPGVGGRLQQAIGQVGSSVRPPAKGDLSAEAQRKARLSSSAWIYSVGFVIAVTALVLTLIFSA
ncbi:MAG TPA: hypothetical protein VM581_04635 [Magnetospirillaceae bacterium]|nr:hypothetical protein [Magnetospirillaceae bacterium]